MPLVVNEVVPPAAEPVTLEEAKLHLRMGDIDLDDALITALISAARRYCQVVAKAVFVDTVFEAVDDAFPFTGGAVNRQVREFYGQFAGGRGAVYPGVLAVNAGIVTLPRAPVRSVESVTYLDLNGVPRTMAPSEYVVTTGSPGRLGVPFGGTWPVTLPQIGAVTVRFTAGYGPDAAAVPPNVKAAVLLMVGHLYENREAVTAGTLSALPLGIDHLLGVEAAAGGYA